MQLYDYLTLFISFAAIIISIIAYFDNLRISKRQLRIEKLEEMLELTHILIGNYKYFEDTSSFKKKILSERSESQEKIKYIKQIKCLNQISESIDLQNKLTRLYVLNNSYLPKRKLKQKIGTFITMYTSIAEDTLSNPYKVIQLPFNNFIRISDFSKFTDEIQNELIVEMGLGYKDSIESEVLYDEELKKRYKL